MHLWISLLACVTSVIGWWVCQCRRQDVDPTMLSSLCVSFSLLMTIISSFQMMKKVYVHDDDQQQALVLPTLKSTEQREGVQAAAGWSAFRPGRWLRAARAVWVGLLVVAFVALVAMEEVVLRLWLVMMVMLAVYCHLRLLLHYCSLDHHSLQFLLYVMVEQEVNLMFRLLLMVVMAKLDHFFPSQLLSQLEAKVIQIHWQQHRRVMVVVAKIDDRVFHLHHHCYYVEVDFVLKPIY
mmetsp:Transcript_6963/g.12183  ORF Transcript_6963/g.12183 Transcript_6963/m.12183 type:complete len:237 (+) Transcript_6963:742-1452(+)